MEKELTEEVSEDQLERDILSTSPVSSNERVWKTHEIEGEQWMESKIHSVNRIREKDGPDEITVHTEVPYYGDCDEHERCKVIKEEWPYEWSRDNFVVELADKRGYDKYSLELLEEDVVLIKDAEKGNSDYVHWMLLTTTLEEATALPPIRTRIREKIVTVVDSIDGDRVVELMAVAGPMFFVCVSVLEFDVAVSLFFAALMAAFMTASNSND